MPYFAHSESGVISDVREALDIESYLAIFSDTEARSGWKIVVVADPSVEGSSSSSSKSYSVMSSADFAEYCYKKLGALVIPEGTEQQKLMAGIIRRGEILLACKNTSDPATFEAYTRFTKADVYAIEAVSIFLNIIGPSPGSGITTVEENGAIINDWPTI